MLCQQLAQFGVLDLAILSVKTTSGEEHGVVKTPFNQHKKKKKTTTKPNSPKQLHATKLVSTEQVGSFLLHGYLSVCAIRNKPECFSQASIKAARYSQ